jgi:hypothetical protein
MQRNLQGRLARLYRGGTVLAALAACGTEGATTDPTVTGDPASSSPRPGAREASAPDARRLICPQCVRFTGGETSDFGDGSEVLPLPGEGSYAAPTPCELSEQVSDIDVDAARALGFGAALDRLQTSFDVDFGWRPGPVQQGGAAAGYATKTRVAGTLGEVTAVRHVAPTLAGCKDSLLVRVGARIDMADGAFSVTGRLTAKLVRDSLYSTVSGYIDLSPAQGTLELHPPDYDELSTFVVPILYLWPDDTRVSLVIIALDPKDFGSDTPSHQYRPLEGLGPDDGCSLSSLPLDVEEPNPYWGGASLEQRFPEVQALLTHSGVLSSWASGGETSVTTELGAPTNACAEEIGYVKYQVPYRVSSADGRVAIEDVAWALAEYRESTLSKAWVEIYPNEVEPADTFVDRTGISGVDFAGHGGARWHTELYFDDQTDDGVSNRSVHGEVTVEGIDVDGSVTGIPGAVTDTPLDQLTW